VADVYVRVHKRECVGVPFHLCKGRWFRGCRLEDQGISAQWVAGIKKPSCEETEISVSEHEGCFFNR
jgi:hypothetical protein